MPDFEVIAAVDGTPESYARTQDPRRSPLRVAAVQQQWYPDPAEHRAALAQGVALAAAQGAKLVCLQELTLSPYFAITADGPTAAGAAPEDLETGPTRALAAELAVAHALHVHASLYERADADDGLGFNTAIVVAPDGTLVARTRKLHIPVTEGYFEDKYFRQGPAGEDAFPVVGVGGARFGFPTCWDQWFPELARAYSLAGAEVLVYPTAIGSEPGHPGFDTQPLWRHVIVGNGITSGTFMVAVNRIGTEAVDGGDDITFYGSSFISDPYGRVLVQAPRDRPAVIVADLDVDQREDWLTLFPFLTTRRPDAYASLADPGVTPSRPVP
jgi:N-carbamoylputrescine amidase